MGKTPRGGFCCFALPLFFINTHMFQDLGIIYCPAQITQFSVVKQDMGDKTINATAIVDYQDTAEQDSRLWEVEYEGERYVAFNPTPQISKDNTMINAQVQIVFKHWAIYELQRHYFTTLFGVGTDAYVPDKYVTSIPLTLPQFCDLLQDVLTYYHGVGKFAVDLCEEAELGADTEPTVVSISNSYIWDVLIKLHELYSVRWEIFTSGDTCHIRVGYGSTEVGHILHYGYEGGLLKIERQVPNENVRNILLGRGGEKNLPFRYFKDIEPNNPTFPADPDWLPELKNVHFTELRSSEFRDYVQGWKTNPNRSRSGVPNLAPKDMARYEVDEYYRKGCDDVRFNPPEYVKDDTSIAKFGELWGALSNNSDIYPTIQKRVIEGIGRVDEVVAADKITTDILERPKPQATTIVVSAARPQTCAIAPNGMTTCTIQGGIFSVAEGCTANFVLGNPEITNYRVGGAGKSYKAANAAEKSKLQILETSIVINGGNSSVGLPSGIYTCAVNVKFQNTNSEEMMFEIAYSPTLIQATADAQQDSGTWSIWIKNLWQTAANAGETPEAYTHRVWDSILGDKENGEASVCFSDGDLSSSEDYTFPILGVEFDDSESINGTPSEWRLILGKSTADFDALGVLRPSKSLQAKAGDHFYFTGIELPHQYVLWAEKALHDYKVDELNKSKQITPTYVVTLDEIRLNDPIDEGGRTLSDVLQEGCSVRLRDAKIIPYAPYETLYIQSVTKNYSADNLNPSVEIVLGNDYETAASAVATLASEVSAIRHQLGGSLGNIEQIVRLVGDKLYLRKDGVEELSVSPTEFSEKISSEHFRNGMIGGNGWGLFKDANNNWVLETDCINVRKQMQVNDLIINQVQARGGMVVESAAAIEVVQVVPLLLGYQCLFDTKGGSVMNTFKVGDIAYCQRFESGITSPKYYKREVTAVDANSIILSRTGDGAGEPAEGDVIVQFGHVSDPARQSVIVRDVLNGGYERFIDGLNSVSASGQEYYFVGKQAGMYNGKARFYLGNDDNFIEFKNGKLTIKGEMTVASTFGGKSFEEVIKGAQAYNFAQNTSVAKTITFPITLSSGVTERIYDVEEGIYDTDPATISFDYNLLATSGSVISYGERPTLEVKLRYERDKLSGGLIGGGEITTPITPTRPRAQVAGGTIEQLTTATVVEVTTNAQLDRAAHRFVLNGFKPAINSMYNYTLKSVLLYIKDCTNGRVEIKNFMAEKSEVASKWVPNPHDTDYLTTALKGSTSVNGGLILTNAVEVKNGEGNVTAGMSGSNSSGEDIAFWAGGTYEQAVGRTANFGVFANGDAYASKNTIRFKPDKVEVGDHLQLTKDGLDMKIQGVSKFSLGNAEVNEKHAMLARLSIISERISFWEEAHVNRSETGGYLLPTVGTRGSTINLGYLPRGTRVYLPEATFAYIDSHGRYFCSPNTYLEHNFIPVLLITLTGKTSEGADFSQGFSVRGCNTDNSGVPTYNIPAGTTLFTPNYDLQDAVIHVRFLNKVSVDDRAKYLGYAEWAETCQVEERVTQLGGKLQICAEYPKAQHMQIGNNGVKFQYNNTAMFQTGDYWGVRCGRYGVAATTNGLMVLDAYNTADGWIDLKSWVRKMIDNRSL